MLPCLIGSNLPGKASIDCPTVPKVKIPTSGKVGQKWGTRCDCWRRIKSPTLSKEPTKWGSFENATDQKVKWTPNSPQRARGMNVALGLMKPAGCPKVASLAIEFPKLLP